MGVLGTIICYDLDYTDTARKLARQGAQLVAVPSNDWPGIAHKHYTPVVFRALENRVAMIKADGGYDSAVVDPRGRVLALAVHPEGGEATLVADVPMGNANSLSVPLGDWVGWLCLAGLAFFSWVSVGWSNGGYAQTGPWRCPTPNGRQSRMTRDSYNSRHYLPRIESLHQRGATQVCQLPLPTSFSRVPPGGLR